MTNDWTDQLAGARMQVDQQFQDRLEASSFTNQEWGLVMTAVEWEIDDPGDPDDATLIADTSHLSDIVPELESITREMGGPRGPSRRDSGDSLLGRLRGYVRGLGSSATESTDPRIEDAVGLVEEYTRELQAHLEDRGRWEDICRAAAKQRGHSG